LGFDKGIKKYVQSVVSQEQIAKSTSHLGDVIQIIRQIDEEWCEGMIGEKTGVFPLSFVMVDLYTPV
jgi:hypothetical protein